MDLGQKKEARPEGGKQLVWILLLFTGFSQDKMIPRLPHPTPPGSLACTRPSREERGTEPRKRPVLGLRGPSGRLAAAAVSGTWSPSHTILRLRRFTCDGGEGTVETRGNMSSPPLFALQLSKGRLLKAGGGCSLGSIGSWLVGDTMELTREGTVCLLMRCDSKSPVAWGACQVLGRHHSCSLPLGELTSG